MSKILIIEDEVILAGVLEKKLKAEGYEVTVAYDGDAGLQKMRDEHPDLVLLDIILPKLNGYQVLEAQNLDESIKNIPVIIISNSGQPVEIDRARRLGIKDYLVKAEFSPDEVMEKVRKQISTPVSRVEPRGDTQVGKTQHGNKKIMIVEDDEFLRGLVVKKFENSGHTVILANDGEDAIKQILEVTPDIVLLDIVLPGIDGFEVLKRLKESEKARHIPVVLLSNLGQHDDLERGKALGAEDFLIKAHYTLDEIIAKVHAILKI